MVMSMRWMWGTSLAKWMGVGVEHTLELFWMEFKREKDWVFCIVNPWTMHYVLFVLTMSFFPSLNPPWMSI